MDNLTEEWLRFEQMSTGDLYEMLRFRQSIFVVEQHSAYPDLDGLDQSAWHLLARLDGELAGYLRLMPVTGPPPLVRIGRVAVASHLRGQGIGRMLMEDAIRRCRQRYQKRGISLGAQVHLVAFYQAFGFATTGEEYDDYGVPHIEMTVPRSN